MSKHKTFSSMASSLRAAAAAGLNTTITLKPDEAKVMAEILETYEDALLADWAEYQEKNAVFMRLPE